MKNVYAICYDTLYVFKNKELAKLYFVECASFSEGSEHERYTNILVDLMFSNIGKDNITHSINAIVCFDDNNNIVEKIKTNWKNYKVAIQEFEEE